jgi:predicted RNA methylase
MARCASVAKLGFFAAPPEAVAALLSHLEAPDPGASTVMDPCAGEGRALEALASGLGIPRKGRYAVELDPERAREAAEHAGARTLHADFRTVRGSPGSFSLSYVNPPFDDELGGGRREEASFLARACPMATAGGVVVLVLPDRVLRSSGEVQACCGAWLDDLAVYRFPEAHRPYDEVVVIGHRRKLPTKPTLGWHEWCRLVDAAGDLGTDDRRWTLPPGREPKVWLKTGHTEAELMEAIRTSRLQDLLRAEHDAPPPSPPLPLHAGHVSLLLAGGLLDGLVRPPGEEPFVVRGTAVKEQYLDASKCSTTEDDKGNTTEKTVFAERIILHVRTASADGTLRDFR